MSKTNPNQIYYKVGGRSQSDGADRGEDIHDDKLKFTQLERLARHPAEKRSKKK